MYRLSVTDYAGMLMVCIVSAANVSAADIYRSRAEDGSEHFSSQRLNETFTLYAQDEAPLAPVAVIRYSARAMPSALEPLIVRFSQKHHVDTDLVRAVVTIESNANARAVSRKGAIGAMQLMQATATQYGVTDRFDAAQNIEAGTRYLKDLLLLHHGNEALALASFNAGPSTVARYQRRLPPYKETMLYVAAVLARRHATQQTEAHHD